MTDQGLLNDTGYSTKFGIHLKMSLREVSKLKSKEVITSSGDVPRSFYAKNLSALISWLKENKIDYYLKKELRSCLPVGSADPK